MVNVIHCYLQDEDEASTQARIRDWLAIARSTRRSDDEELFCMSLQNKDTPAAAASIVVVKKSPEFTDASPLYIVRLLQGNSADNISHVRNPKTMLSGEFERFATFKPPSSQDDGLVRFDYYSSLGDDNCAVFENVTHEALALFFKLSDQIARCRFQTLDPLGKARDVGAQLFDALHITAD